MHDAEPVNRGKPPLLCACRVAVVTGATRKSKVSIRIAGRAACYSGTIANAKGERERVCIEEIHPAHRVSAFHEAMPVAYFRGDPMNARRENAAISIEIIAEQKGEVPAA